MTTPTTSPPLLASAETQCAAARASEDLVSRREVKHAGDTHNLRAPSADALMSARRKRGWDEPPKKGGLGRVSACWAGVSTGMWYSVPALTCPMSCPTGAGLGSPHGRLRRAAGPTRHGPWALRLSSAPVKI